MKKTVKYISSLLLAMVSGAFAQSSASMPAPENPATGIWIQQKGDIVPHAATKATLYYTKYENDKNGDRIKSISYQYDGAGYLLMKPSDKKTLCSYNDGVRGADGIVHHPDGDLIIAGQQGGKIYKVSKTAKADGGKCLVKTANTRQGEATTGVWHMMMDPTQKWVWASGIPGPLFRFATTDDETNKLASVGYRVGLRSERHPDTVTTIIWDADGTAYFTYSDYYGGGCERNNGNGVCSDADRLKENKKAYFGVFTDTTKVLVTNQNIGTVGGKLGDSVITSVGTKVLIDALEGAHGGAYDTYSKTIFVFGGARIVQIRPYRDMQGKPQAEVVATIDLREYFFNEGQITGPRTPGVGWRLDQGTTDGYGHLFVASNTGHMVFVDYSSNKNKWIDGNVLVHVQWIDNYLDDLAPLSGVGIIRTGGNTSSDDELSSNSHSSSSLVEYHESSSSVKSSSSSTGNSGSSSSGLNSSGSNGNSSDSQGNSSGSNGGSSDSQGNSSGSNGGSSDSQGNSSGSNGGSSDSQGNSSGSNGGSSDSQGSSSGSNGGHSSGSVGSSSSGGNGGNNSSGNENGSSSSRTGSGDDESENSSSSRAIGSGDDEEERSSSSRVYFGADDYEEPDDSDFDSYPSVEAFEKGDSLVAGVVKVNPKPIDPNNPNMVEINGSGYELTNNPKGESLDLRYNSGKDSAKVGEVIAITLDPEKVKEYFSNPDSIKVKANGNILLLDSAGNKTDMLVINADGSVTIYVTADQVVEGGSIKVVGGGRMVIIDNLNFYDPIPDSNKGYIKDTDGDLALDYVEILLDDTLSRAYDIKDVQLIVNGKPLDCVNPKLNKNRDRIIVEKLSEYLTLPSIGKFPRDAKALITYVDGFGATYVREVPIVEMGSSIIKEAYAIRHVKTSKDSKDKGLDSLFLLFNIDLIPADLSSPEMLVRLKQAAEPYGFDLEQIKKVYMPTQNIVILAGTNYKLQGEDKDSVSLYPNVTFDSLPYITSDEYDRQVPVRVTDRFPTSKNVEYWDTDGDGVLDRIVTVFDRKLTEADIDGSLYLSFPWYSYRGMLIQLQAQPEALKIDPDDSTRVIWEVFSTTELAKGVTSISEKLPEANVYTYYHIFGETFVNEESAPLVDKMPPVVASATLSYGKKADTLLVAFSEPIQTKGLQGSDYFSYIHGKDKIDLYPSRIDWSSDGLTAKLVFNGDHGTIMPGDSLVVHKGSKDWLKDNYGNKVGEKPQAVVIGGLLNHLVEGTNMGSFDISDDRVVDEDDDKKTYTLQTVSSVNLRYVPGTTTKEDMEREGALGQLVQLGERFVPQLLDAAQVSADGSYDPNALDSIKPEDVYISFIVNYFDNLGQYVNDTTITVPCKSPKFGGNCLDTDKKVFVNWNFKDHKGRFVGTGVYNVQFKMVVRYEDKKIVEEIKDKWGVRRKKHKK